MNQFKFNHSRKLHLLQLQNNHGEIKNGFLVSISSYHTIKLDTDAPTSDFLPQKVRAIMIIQDNLHI